MEARRKKYMGTLFVDQFRKIGLFLYGVFYFESMKPMAIIACQRIVKNCLTANFFLNVFRS